MSAINGNSPNLAQQMSQFRNQALSSLGANDSGTAQGGQSSDSFKNLLVESISHVNSMQQDANTAVETLMTGGKINSAEVLTAMQKADMSFRMMQQIRNKIVDAFQEIKEIRI